MAMPEAQSSSGPSARMDVQSHMTNTRNAPIEAAYPLRVEDYGQVPDAEGAGRHRSDMGMRPAIRVLGDQVMLTQSSDRAKVIPWGLFGGLAASGMRSTVISSDGRPQSLPTKATTRSFQKSSWVGLRAIGRSPGWVGWEQIRWVGA